VDSRPSAFDVPRLKQHDGLGRSDSKAKAALMKVIFAPDYRAGNRYQEHLARALRSDGISIEFLSDYRRGLPLWRGSKAFDADLLHLHWPEKYYQRRADGFDLLRRIRYPLDLRLAASRLPMVLTAHDLLPHNRGTEVLMRRNHQITLSRARAVFVHSDHALHALSEAYDFDNCKCWVIPHGDLSGSSPLPEKRQSRVSLNLPQHEPICLMFGRVEPYKGIEEVIASWKKQTGASLAVVGEPIFRSICGSFAFDGSQFASCVFLP
jgi:beta-1,4-mannosyltransferase